MRDDAPDPVQDTPFDRRPWLAFIRYGAAAVLVVCSFLWFRDRSKHTDCSDIVATLWDWNLARLLGDISRCPHPSGESINGITAAFFIVWPVIVFVTAALVLMQLDRVGALRIADRLKSLLR